MANLKERFESFTSADAYMRVDETHPLDLYIGIDEYYRWTLLLICTEMPGHVTGSKMIDVRVGERKDGKYTLTLALINKEFSDIFVLFCSDIIDSSRNVNKHNGTNFIVKRYLSWREMLSATKNELMSPEKIKGLLGEMYFLDTILLDKYGNEKGPLSWTGPKAYHQDFIVDDTWYEVKTVSSGSEEIKISSIEQLDCENPGTLVVIYADNTSETNEDSFTLNKLYNKLIDEIKNDDIKEKFANMLLKFGYYPRPEYDDSEYIFDIKGLRLYQVDYSFPCLRRSNLLPAITKAEYMLSLPAIQEYLEEA